MGTKELGMRNRASSRHVVHGITISELREKHQTEAENLTLTIQPVETLKLFILAIVQYLKQLLVYLMTKGVWLPILCVLILVFGFYISALDGPHHEHVQEFLKYLRFAVWWVALGVASSIGLGFGLHTFVLYLGPHIALFTIKAMQCGRVDLKSALYDTIQLGKGPSWLEKDCSAYGPPIFHALPNSSVRVPLTSILSQVQLEAILWGFGTVLGELPPYFVSRAAYLSGRKMDAVKGLNSSSKESGGVSGCLKRLEQWLFSHSQHLNFASILVLASVPNPLFDLAGMMCGQFGVPFWKFFLATLTGKALIKTHMQTTFIISVCNNQLLEWIEKEMMWAFGHVPGIATVLRSIISNLHKVKEMYHEGPSAHTLKASWNLSWSTIWTTFVWLVLVHFFAKIVAATAQNYLLKQQEQELAALAAKQSISRHLNGEACHFSQAKLD